MITADAPPRVIDLTLADTPSRRRAAIWPVLAWVGGWSAFVLVVSGLVSAQKHIPLRYTIVSEAVNYYTLAAISLVVWAASARLATWRWSWPAQAGAQVALGIALVAAWQITYSGYLRIVIGPRAWDIVFRDTWMFQLMNACVLYAGVLGTTLAIQAARRARVHERRQHELALLARDAELRALTAQLEPHFLLNTLNSVLALIDASPGEARTMIERLADLLKATFDERRDGDVTLGRELDLIAAYLGIEQVRFADRLTVTVDVPDSARAIRVPPFLLQPIVENAIKHGIAPFTHAGSIAIRAVHDRGRVRIDIADSGRGFDRDRVSGRGRGLLLAERRLQAFAPGGELLVSRNAPGCVVTLAFPV